jgi:hypothetical protein
MKESYEAQISELQQERDQLVVELQDWKSRAQTSSHTLNQLQQEVARDLSPSSSGRADGGKLSITGQLNPKKGKKKTSSVRSQFATGLEPLANNVVNLTMANDSESTAFTDRMHQRKESETKGLVKSGPGPSKRSPLGAHNAAPSHQQPLFPPKSNRPLSPTRSRSPLASTSLVKRSNSPKGSVYDENSSFRSAQNRAPMVGQAAISEATSSNGTTYFHRLRSNLNMRS